jgi:hypothetical protein
MNHNIFAWTAPGADYPEFVSINERDGKVIVAVRGPKRLKNPRPQYATDPDAFDRCGETVEMTLPAEQIAPLAKAMAREELVNHMVNRFLGWKLPENFSPDAGISFKAAFNEHTAHPMKHEPSGTNLFDAGQAEAMVRYMLEGMPVS